MAKVLVFGASQLLSRSLATPPVPIPCSPPAMRPSAALSLARPLWSPSPALSLLPPCVRQLLSLSRSLSTSIPIPCLPYTLALIPRGPTALSAAPMSSFDQAAIAVQALGLPTEVARPGEDQERTAEQVLEFDEPPTALSMAQGKCRVLLLAYEDGAGLNLQHGCHHVVLYAPLASPPKDSDKVRPSLVIFPCYVLPSLTFPWPLLSRLLLPSQRLSRPLARSSSPSAACAARGKSIGLPFIGLSLRDRGGRRRLMGCCTSGTRTNS